MSGKQDFFTMSAQEKKEAGFVSDCTLEHYNLMGRAMKDRANINPPGVGDSGRRRRKKIVLPDPMSSEEQQDYTSVNEVNGTPGDDFNTAYLKNPVIVPKKRRKNAETASESEEQLLKETLTEINNAFCEKMGSIFIDVMEKASDREDKNVEKLMQASHEDIASILAGLKDILNK
jgi:hypothetical protein